MAWQTMLPPMYARWPPPGMALAAPDKTALEQGVKELDAMIGT